MYHSSTSSLKSFVIVVRSFVTLFVMALLVLACSDDTGTSQPRQSQSGGASAGTQSSGGSTTSSQPQNTRSTPGAGQFSMSTADTRKPADILQDAKKFAGGAGGEGAQCPASLNNTSPRIQWGLERHEIMPVSRTSVGAGTFYILSCGWSSTGQLPVTVRYPNGQETNHSTVVQRGSGGGLSAEFALDFGTNPQLGNYRITFRGRSGSATHTFTLERPAAPIFYTLANGDIVLWNFRPNENVRLAAYQTVQNLYSDVQFVGYQSYVTDSDGSLYVNVTGSFAGFIAFGERTGAVEDSNWMNQIMLQ
jgi:hypothetical protein